MRQVLPLIQKYIFTLTLLLSFFALLGTITVVSAETAGGQPKDPVAWQPLNPSNPEHATILGWHQALVSNDYQSYLRYVGRIPGLSEATMKMSFDNNRATTPPTLMINVEPSHINPNGSKDYAVAGCMKAYGDNKEIRMVAGITTIKKDGEWKIVASGFSPPWNTLVRACPVK